MTSWSKCLSRITSGHLVKEYSKVVQILQDRQTDRHTDNDRLSKLVCTFPKNALLHYILGDIEPFTEVFDPDICQYVHLCRAEEKTLAALGKQGGGAQGGGVKLPFYKTSRETQVALEETSSVLVAVVTGSPAHWRPYRGWLQRPPVPSLSLGVLRREQGGP